jgi:hypothetical protein
MIGSSGVSIMIGSSGVSTIIGSDGLISDFLESIDPSKVLTHPSQLEVLYRICPSVLWFLQLLSWLLLNT